MRKIKLFGSLVILILALIVTKVGAFAQMGKVTSSFNERWLDAVISIEMEEPSGNIRPIGTGFLVLTLQKHLLLYTAAHVIQDKDKKVLSGLRYRRTDIEGASAVITEELLQSTGGPWFFSKHNDIACRFVGWPVDVPDAKGIPLSDALEAAQLNTGAPLIVLGFPVGLRSTTHKHPIARSGMVARVGEEGIVVESFVFPGNSGGPVVYAPMLKFGKGIESPLLNEEKLVGMISSYIPYQETAISPQTGRPRIIFEENSGLAEVIPVAIIRELANREDVKKLESQLN